MKQAAKVFIWMGMIIQFYLIYPVVIGIFALRKIEETTEKNELQTLGVLTMLFCSLLGGIFMLCIKDEDLIFDNENTIIIKKEKVKMIEEVEEKTMDTQKFKTFTQIGLYLLCALLLICEVFCIIPISKYWGYAYIPLIFNLCQIALFVPIIIMYFSNKQRLSLSTIILLSFFTVISIVSQVMALQTNYEYAYSIGVSHMLYGEGWEYWVVFGISCITTILSLSILVVNLENIIATSKKEQINKTNKPQTKQIVTSKMEIELTEAVRLYENKLVTEEEYNKIRASIIAKYYK